jgi:iron complex outermembrane receptor protein
MPSIKKSRTAHLRPLPALLGALFATGPVMAADSQVFSLGQIVISAAPLRAGTIGSTAIDADQMRQNDRATVGEALDLLPGINLSKQGQRNEQMVWVRGFNLRQVPVFVDGIPVYVPYDGYVDLGRFTPFDLSRIDVSKGFSSALYGANTLGGAINLVSRRPAGEFEGEIGGGLTATRGQMNGQQAYTNLGTNRGTWYLQAGVSYVNQDFYRLPDRFAPAKGEDGGRRDNSASHDAKLNLKVGLTPNATDEYAFNYIRQHGVKNDPPYAGLAANVAPAYWQWPYWDKESLYFLSSTRVGEQTVKLRAYHDTFRNSLAAFDDASYTTMKKASSFTSWYDDYTDGLSVQDDVRLSAVNLLRGSYNIKDDIHREHNAGEPVRHFKDRTQSLALEDSHAFDLRLSLATGLSFEQRDSLEAQDYNSSTGKISDFARANPSATNGQAGLSYQLIGGDALHASVARKSRFPTIKDRYSYKMGKALPNPDLKTERAVHYEIGYDGKLAQAWRVEANLFHSDISNLIQSATLVSKCGASACTQSQNVGEASADGFELGLRGTPADWDVVANYTYLKRVNRSSADVLTDTPRQKLFASALWRAGHGVDVSASAEAYTRRYSSSDGSQVAPGFMVVNLKAGYLLSNGTRLEAGARNLFDRLYEYVEGYPEAGRTYFVQFNTPL